jgi:ATP-dependent DNA ligase
MFKAFDFCLPTKSTIVPDGPDWLHKINYDGYRLRVERDGDRVRLITSLIEINLAPLRPP